MSEIVNDKGYAKLDWPALLETALTVPGNLGNVYDRFYRYSYLNKLNFLMQGITTPVGTYKKWQELGRHVVKGSSAKYVLRPITITKRDDEGEVESQFTRFKYVKAIFELKDTAGEDLPKAEIPAWNYSHALDELEIKEVPFQSLDGNTQGYSVGRELAVSPVAVYPAKTRFHEIGHIMLDHTVPSALGEYSAHRGRFEFQAESTAYLCMNELDELTEDAANVSRGYIQTWLHGERPADAHIRPVFSATDKILRAGYMAVSAEAAA